MAKQRKKIDWEVIEREFKAGQLSIREIARRSGCADSTIRKKAKNEGWNRDLSEEIRRAVRTELVRSEVRTPNAAALTEKEIVDAGVTLGVEIELLQRKDIANLRALEVELLDELRGDPTKLYITQHKGEIIQQTVSIAVTEKSSALNNLDSVQQKRIQLERQAYNLDDANEEGKDKKILFKKLELPAEIQDLIPLKR